HEGVNNPGHRRATEGRKRRVLNGRRDALPGWRLEELVDCVRTRNVARRLDSNIHFDQAGHIELRVAILDAARDLPHAPLNIGGRELIGQILVGRAQRIRLVGRPLRVLVIVGRPLRVLVIVGRPLRVLVIVGRPHRTLIRCAAQEQEGDATDQLSHFVLLVAYSGLMFSLSHGPNTAGAVAPPLAGWERIAGNSENISPERTARAKTETKASERRNGYKT